MTETIATRLKRVRKAKNITQAELAARVGLTQSGIGNIEAGTRGYGAKVVEIAKVLGTTPDYLQLVVAAQAGATNIAPAAIGRAQIPLIDYVQAGMWTEVSNPYEAGDGSEFLLTDLELSVNAFALEIKGNSMAPEFNPGDRVIIDPAVVPQAGDYVVAKNGGEEATFKKYRLRGHNERGDAVFELIPLNEDYAPIRSDQQPIHIVGTMVEHRKYRKRR